MFWTNIWENAFKMVLWTHINMDIKICCTFYLYLPMSKSNLTHYLSNALVCCKVTRAGENQFKHMKLHRCSYIALLNLQHILMTFNTQCAQVKSVHPAGYGIWESFNTKLCISLFWYCLRIWFKFLSTVKLGDNVFGSVCLPVCVSICMSVQALSNFWHVVVDIRDSACLVQQKAITLKFGVKSSHYQSEVFVCL